jgi:CheY-like chemotaxis protein
MTKVLLIEPDLALARTYIQALAHAGHTVTHVTGAQEAVLAADAKAPEVVVLELRLAVHDGIEFLHEFRSYGEWQRIPVIINSHLEPSVIEQVQAALEHDFGVTTYLYKPATSLQQLISTVNQQVIAA